MHSLLHTPSTQTADMEHLQDFEKDVRALLPEVMWFLNMRTISPSHEEDMRESVHNVEVQLRRLISTDLSTAVRSNMLSWKHQLQLYDWDDCFRCSELSRLYSYLGDA